MADQNPTGKSDGTATLALIAWVSAGIGVVVLVITVILLSAVTTVTKADGTTGTVGVWFNPASHQLTSAQWFDVARSAATLLIPAGGVLLAALAYRRQRTSEAQQATDAKRLMTLEDQLALERETRNYNQNQDQQRRDDERATDLRTRFGTATEQLGHKSAAVRLGGVYALAQVADDWSSSTNLPGHDQQVQQCINVLCAYFRLPVDPDSARAKDGDGQVRDTVISVITAHLQDPDADNTWCERNLNFAGATLDRDVSFAGAKFSGATVSFDGAKFSGATVRFDGAVFSGGTVRFDGAVFSGGTVRFDGAVFSGGTVRFYDAVFSGGVVSFAESVFSGGVVRFYKAVFSGGVVRFYKAVFSGGLVSFKKAVFSGGLVSFLKATFSGGTVRFLKAVFSGGRVSFSEAVFSGGVVRFYGAVFSGGTVSFTRAVFSGGDIEFIESVFAGGLLSMDWGPGSTPPAGVTPSPWPPT